jgi:hypothetical protein
MTKAKTGRRLALLALSALGLMVAFIASAQAGEAGKFWLGKEGGFLLATFTGSQEGTFKELSFGNDLVVNCQVGGFKKGAIETTTLGEAEIAFSECTVLSDATGKELPCTVDEPFIVKAKIVPSLHIKTKRYVTFEPLVAGAPLGTLVLLGEGCAVKGSYPVTGSISAEMTINNSVKNLITFSQGFSQLVKDTLKMGAFQAFWTGKYTWELTGVHTGIMFGVI